MHRLCGGRPRFACYRLGAEVEMGLSAGTSAVFDPVLGFADAFAFGLGFGSGVASAECVTK
jgi:hypothetical protein